MVKGMAKEDGSYRKPNRLRRRRIGFLAVIALGWGPWLQTTLGIICNNSWASTWHSRSDPGFVDMLFTQSQAFLGGLGYGWFEGPTVILDFKCFMWRLKALGGQYNIEDMFMLQCGRMWLERARKLAHGSIQFSGHHSVVYFRKAVRAIRCPQFVHNFGWRTAIAMSRKRMHGKLIGLPPVQVSEPQVLLGSVWVL